MHAARILVHAHDSVFNHHWQAGFTGLFMASMNGHLDVVRLLLDSKADANLTDQVPAPGATRPQTAHQLC
jgi:ankyrin repeat protein